MFILPDLPYAYEALQPVLSSELMHLHHDKHHATYVNNVNKFLGDAGRTAESMEALVRESATNGDKKMFNNAGQSWNHAFFWECMGPGGGGAPGGDLAAAIDKTFGGLAGLKEKFVAEGVGHFGSGWAWLGVKDGALVVFSTHDAGCPLTDGIAPVLVCDVWEHAYYLDFKNDRKSFLETWFDKLANWRFAEAQFAAASGGGVGYQYPKPT